MVRINLLPIREILRKRYLKRFILLSCAALAVTVGIMALWYFAESMKLSHLAERRASLDKKQASLAEHNKAIDILVAKEAQLKKRLEEFRRLIEDRDSVARLMAAVSQSIPDDLWLDSLEKSKNREFALIGRGLDNNSIITFVDRLQTLKGNFSETNTYQDASRKDEPAFFAEVKLDKLGSATETKEDGRGTVNFKIVGRIR
jgi:type IV pilus assembly protein PilN